MRVLITGGAGFIGHHVCEHILKNTNWEIIVFDSLTYASSGFNRLKDVEVYDDSRVTMISADFTRSLTVGLKKEIGQVDYIIHMGAETHVDRSISNAYPFVISNVLGTLNILEFAREQIGLKMFVYFSTDEVFGPAPEGVAYKEWDRYDSGNPYAATKAGGEELALSFSNTHKIPVLVTHTMNVFGERQHPEKFVPLCIKKIIKGETIKIHADYGRTRSGSRCWIHARDVAAALLHCLEHALYYEGQYDDRLITGEKAFRDKINIVGEEKSNLEIAQFIADELGEELKYEMVDFHSQRPGHDLRYALDGSKLRDSWKFTYPKGLNDSLAKTINWYLHPEWKHWLDPKTYEAQHLVGGNV